jgi:hypothetical protein
MTIVTVFAIPLNLNKKSALNVEPCPPNTGLLHSIHEPRGQQHGKKHSLHQ